MENTCVQQENPDDVNECSQTKPGTKELVSVCVCFRVKCFCLASQNSWQHGLSTFSFKETNEADVEPSLSLDIDWNPSDESSTQDFALTSAEMITCDNAPVPVCHVKRA